MTQRARPIHGRELAREWAEALGIDLSQTRRIVIDIPCHDVVRVYVEQFGTERLLKITPPSDGLNIEVI